MVKVKFCGLKRPCDIAWANELRPDYAGFVFAGKKRRVSDDQAAALRKALDPSIPAVGVFVDDSLKHIGQLVTAGTIQIVRDRGLFRLGPAGPYRQTVLSGRRPQSRQCRPGGSAPTLCPGCEQRH